MEQRDKILEEYYAQMGIAKPVYDFCMKVEEELKDRFYLQIKLQNVIR